MANGGPTTLVNQTVLLRLNFTGADVEDPAATVRLVSPSGTEVPSVVVGTQTQGIFLRSAYLLFSADLPPQSTQTFYVYYGAASGNVPSYRSQGPAGTMLNGFMAAVSVPLAPDSSQVQLSFGTVDSETTATKVTYGSGGQHDFGPSTISSSPFSNDTGLTLAGQLGSGATVAYEALGAGALQLTRILILGSRGATTVDALANAGGTALTNVGLTSVIGLDGLASLGTSSTVYDPANSLLYTQNIDAYFGVQPSAAPSSFTVGTVATVNSEAMNSSFSSVSAYVHASEAGFLWQLGTVQPLGSTWVSSAWSVSPDLGHLSAALTLPIGASLGNAETLDVATPKARVLWEATASFTNVAIPPSGLVIPFGIGGGELIPSASSFSGTYIYSVPPSGSEDPRSWSTETSATGNATAYSSPQYYDFLTGRSVERVNLHIPSGGTGEASLVSDGSFALGGANDLLQISYKASFGVSAGSLSSQYLFVAADLAPSGANNFTQTLFLPVVGSSTSLSAGVCAPARPAPQNPTSVIDSGSLIGDNLWRTVSVALPSSLPSGGFGVRLRLCLSTSAGFSGDMNLELGPAGIVSRGQVTRFVVAGWSAAPSAATVNFLPQASLISTSGITANLTMTLVFQVSSNMSWADGTTFAGSIPPPPAFVENNPLLRPSAILGAPKLLGVIVGSSVGGYAYTGTVNGISEPVAAGPGTAFLNTSGVTTVQVTTPFTVSLRGVGFGVTVVDQAGSGVPAAEVTVSSDGVKVPISAVTYSTGTAQFLLVPSNYMFNATYQGTEVGSTTASVGTQPTATIQAGLYQVTLVILDSRKGTISDAHVYLGVGNGTQSGVTDSQGRYTFDGIANSIYPLTVGVGNVSVLTWTISASAIGVVIQVTTTYVTLYTQLLVAVLLSATSVVIVVAFYLLRKLERI